MNQPKASSAARVSAATALLDRGWGKANQPHSGDDGEGPMVLLIRHIDPTARSGDPNTHADEVGPPPPPPLKLVAPAKDKGDEPA